MATRRRVSNRASDMEKAEGSRSHVASDSARATKSRVSEASDRGAATKSGRRSPLTRSSRSRNQ